MRKKIVAIIAVIVLAAGGYFAWQTYLSPVAKAKQAVKAALKDPDSAVFENVTYIKRSGATCGDVNAKNSMGGYAGSRAFVVDKQSRVHFAPSSETKSGPTEQRIAAMEEHVAFLELAEVCFEEVES